MKIDSSFLLLTGALFFSTSLFSQSTPEAKMTPVARNTASSAATMATIKIADTTTMKITKLQEENKTQQQELADLKAAVATLTSKCEKDHFELGVTKLLLKNINEFQVPVAYAAFNPVKDPVTNGYGY